MCIYIYYSVCMYMYMYMYMHMYMYMYMHMYMYVYIPNMSLYNRKTDDQHGCSQDPRDKVGKTADKEAK